MGWGMILKIIRDKYVVWKTRVEVLIGRTDQEHWALQGFDALEWRTKVNEFVCVESHWLFVCRKSSAFE
jgi:hypothetical protein